MATHDYNIANQSSAAFRADLNNALLAIVSQNSSATAPATTFADMLWYDSANKQLKKRNEADSAWITLGTVNEGAGTFTTTGTLGLGFDVNNTLSINSGSGVTSTADDDGTFSSGTYTPTPVGGNMKRIINGGAFTLAVPTASGDYTLVIQITNNATAGAITLSGFNRTTGSSFTTTNGHTFLVFITKCNNIELCNVVAMQ
jgi:hypothetical protein